MKDISTEKGSSCLLYFVEHSATSRMGNEQDVKGTEIEFRFINLIY